MAVDDRAVVAATVGQGPHPGSREGSLVALDAHSGKMLWMLLDPPSQAGVDEKRDWGFASSPILSKKIAYAADLSGTVYALQAY